jgi:hypothetical protein
VFVGPSKPKDEQHRLIAHLAKLRRHRVDVQRISIEARLNGNILLAAYLEGHWRGIDAATDVEMPQPIKAHVIVGGHVAGGRASNVLLLGAHPHRFLVLRSRVTTVSEALCQSAVKAKELNAVIPDERDALASGCSVIARPNETSGFQVPRLRDSAETWLSCRKFSDAIPGDDVIVGDDIARFVP